MNDKTFDLHPSIIRTTEERIEMVTDPDCPLDVLFTVAKHDTIDDVIEACAFNKNVTDEIMTIVSNRLGRSPNDLRESAYIYQITKNPNHQNSFCILPWIHVATNADGSIRACCQMIHDDSKMPYGNIIKDDGNILTGYDKLDGNRNAENWKYLRREFLKGNRPNVCKLCWDEEDNGIVSLRQSSIHEVLKRNDKSVISNAMSLTGNDGEIDERLFPVERWDLRFGNKCNLKCRTCGPTDSDQWYGDWIALGRGNTFKIRNDDNLEIRKSSDGKKYEVPRYAWYEDSPLWNHIVENLDAAKQFYFTGGEPTINHKHNELLKIMIDRGIASNIILQYNTNMASITKNIRELWTYFERVDIGMSIDGIGTHFEYIRHPGKWEVVERNIEILDKDATLTNIRLHITLTLSIMNVLHILDMMKWLENKKFNRVDQNIVVHNLYGPRYYNIQNLPISMKKDIDFIYGEFIKTIKNSKNYIWAKHATETLMSIQNHMNSKEANMKDWNYFIRLNEELDTIRNENWQEYLPELAELIRKHT